MIKDLRGKRRTTLAKMMLVLAVVPALALAACSSSSTSAGSTSTSTGSTAAASAAASASCSGTPLKLMTIEPLTSPIQHEPEIPDAAQAAAEAITKSCELGRPLQVISCDDQYDPNAATACGREAVADDVLAIVGTTSAYTQNFIPITTAAGIPDVGDTADSAAQLTNKLVFPLQNAITLTNGQATVAKSLGAKKVVIVSIDVPAVTTILNLVEATIKAQGMQYISPILVPPTTTDLTQAAAQALAAGANAILPVLPTPLTVTLINDLHQAGANFNTTHFICGGTVLGPDTIAQLGSTANGVDVTDTAWPASDNSNTGIAQYNKELAAAGFSNINKDDSSVIAWSTVHLIANLLQGSATMNTATLVKKLRAFSSSAAYPQLAPFGFSASAFPGNPAFSAINAYSHDFVVTQALNGVLKPVTNGWVDYRSPFTITPIKA